MSRRRDCTHRAGFTLVELLVTTVILALVLAIATQLLGTSSRVFYQETAAVGLQDDAASAKNILLDDMSIAGYGLTPATTFVSVSDSQGGTNWDTVAFEAGGNRYCYQLSSGKVQRKIVNSGTACGTTGFDDLAVNVQTFRLTFLDKSYAPITTASAITTASTPTCYVKVSISTQATARGATLTKTLTGQSSMRNTWNTATNANVCCNNANPSLC